MKLNSVQIAFLGMALLGLSNLQGHAQIITPVFQTISPQAGQTSRDYQFTGLSQENYPTYPSFASGDHSGQGAWTAPISANGGNTVETFNKPTATDYSDFVGNASGGGIYSFSTETTYTLTGTAPLSNLQSLTFQLYQAGGATGTNGDYVGLISLVLNLANSTQQTLTLSSGSVLGSTSATVFGMPTTLNDTGFTFDLSSVSQPITSYAFSVQTGMHSVLYGADVTEVAAAPEPATWTMMGLGLGALFFFFRSRRTQLA